MLSLAIQAGGESSRMGQDKALLPLQGQPLVSRVMARLSGIASEIFVTTNRPEDFRFLAVPLYPDLYPGTGALGGLYTALQAAGQPLVAVVACDMPFASADLLAYSRDRLLSSGADVAIPRSEEGFEPFHAVYRRETCLPAVKKALEAGERRLISWFPDVIVSPILPEEWLPHDPDLLAFWNLNTPEDFRQAERWIASNE
jgi:molybdopterin-guanine dinucleotide biosynthesis protein A